MGSKQNNIESHKKEGQERLTTVLQSQREKEALRIDPGSIPKAHMTEGSSPQSASAVVRQVGAWSQRWRGEFSTSLRIVPVGRDVK